MTFEEKLVNQEYGRIWQEYGGFLDLDMESYMKIQRRLLQEQIRLWCASPLGKKILKGRKPETVEKFRSMVPLTTYEGGRHPIKIAPYTNGMLQTYKNNIITCLMMAVSRGWGGGGIGIGDTFLYGLAPLPYITGLIPLGLSDQFHMEFLPPADKAVNMTFYERNKKGLGWDSARDTPDA